MNSGKVSELKAFMRLSALKIRHKSRFLWEKIQDTNFDVNIPVHWQCSMLVNQRHLQWNDYRPSDSIGQFVTNGRAGNQSEHDFDFLEKNKSDEGENGPKMEMIRRKGSSLRMHFRRCNVVMCGRGINHRLIGQKSAAFFFYSPPLYRNRCQDGGFLAHRWRPFAAMDADAIPPARDGGFASF